jgi:hypothetical protein
MTLKKSDKIIAIFGVIILIVAAVGIYLYAGVEEKEEMPIMEEKPVFEIMYDEVYSVVLPDNQDYTIKPKILGSSSNLYMVEINQQNLKSVDVFVEYSDNKVGFLPNLGIIGRIGADTITVIVYDSQENELGRAGIKGSGNISIAVKSDASMISMEPIEAEDLQEAITKLEERYIDYNEEYTIKISLKTGLWGKIRERLLGKDSFQLDITYSFYDYYIIETIPGDDSDGDGDLPPTGENQGSQTWSPMAYPGKN